MFSSGLCNGKYSPVIFLAVFHTFSVTSKRESKITTGVLVCGTFTQGVEHIRVHLSRLDNDLVSNTHLTLTPFPLPSEDMQRRQGQTCQ